MFAFEEYIKSHKILILNGATQLSHYENIVCDNCYRPFRNRWDKIQFKIYEHLPATLLDRSRWYSSWKNHVSEYDTIIIINNIRGRDVIEYMRSKNRHARIIIYYETTIDPSDRKAPHYYQGLGVEFSSFDKKDCEQWGLRYEPYFYSFAQGTLEEIRAGQSGITPETDVFFVGYDKHRLHALVSLQQKFDQLGIRHRMYIIPPPHHPHHPYRPSDKTHLAKTFLPYPAVMRHIYQSKCILDFVEEGQTGITLRPMEAVWFQKKLITNNPDVMHYDFYCPENVFILGKDDMTTLREFMDAPYRPLPTEVAQNYTAEAWLDRMLGENCTVEEVSSSCIA